MNVSPNFEREEFACRDGCGFDTVDVELIGVLEGVREHFRRPVTISSGARCKKHNAAVGGSKKSQHRIGKAADIVVTGIKAELVADFLEAKYATTYGVGRYENWTHIDVRKEKARWAE